MFPQFYHNSFKTSIPLQVFHNRISVAMVVLVYHVSLSRSFIDDAWLQQGMYLFIVRTHWRSVFAAMFESSAGNNFGIALSYCFFLVFVLECLYCPLSSCFIVVMSKWEYAILRDTKMPPDSAFLAVTAATARLLDCDQEEISLGGGHVSYSGSVRYLYSRSKNSDASSFS